MSNVLIGVKRWRAIVKQNWTNEELVEHWTLSSKDLDLIGDNKTNDNLLRAACLIVQRFEEVSAEQWQ